MLIPIDESNRDAILPRIKPCREGCPRDHGLRLPRFQVFFDEFIHQRGTRRFFSIDIRPDEETIRLDYEDGAGKPKLARRKIPHVCRSV